MRRLSSRITFFYKRVFPIVFFGLVLLFIAFWLVSLSGRSPGVPFLIALVLVLALFFFGMKKLVFYLVDGVRVAGDVDEVREAGDALIIRNRGEEERVALSDIMNISYSPLVSPPRVTLSLGGPSIFGREGTFC